MTSTYSPDNPLVLKVGMLLLDVLIETEKCHEAEPYARTYYEGLSKILGGDSIEVGHAAAKLANILYHLTRENGLRDIVEAEMLNRIAISFERVYGRDRPFTSGALCTQQQNFK